MSEEKIALIFQADGAERFNKEVKESELALRRQARTLNESQRALQQEVVALRSAAQPNKALIAEKQRLIQAYGLQQRAIRAQVQAMKEEENAAKKAAASTADFRAGVEQLLPASATMVTRLGLIAGGFVAVGLAVKKSLDIFAPFERTLNTIAAVADTTDAELRRIEQSSKDLGQSTIFNNQEVADSYLNLSRAGFTVQESLDAMPGLLNLAAAAGGDLSNAATITAGTLRGFGLEAAKSGHVADLLAQSANKSSADVADLGDALTQIAPVASNANQPVEEMVTSLSLLADRMIKGSDAGTDLRAILTRLAAPPKEAAEALNTLGIKISDSTGKIRPLLDIVKDLQVQLQKYNQEGQLKFLENIAGLSNIKSLATLVNLTTEEIDNMREAMGAADGAAGRMANRINQGLIPAWQQLTGSLETAATNLGKALAPAIVGTLNGLTEMITVVNKLWPAIDSIVGSFLRGAAAIGSFVFSVLEANPLVAALTSGITRLVEWILNGESASQKIARGFYGVATAVEWLSLKIQELTGNMQAGLDTFGGWFRFFDQSQNRPGGSTPIPFGAQANSNLQKKRAESRSRLDQLHVDLGLAPKSAPVPGKPKSPGKQPGNRPAPATGDDKSDQKAIRAEREKLNDLKSDLSDRLADIRSQARSQTADLDVGANEAEKLNIRLASASKESQEIFKYTQKLVALQVKTKEAQKDKTRLVKDLQRDIADSNTDIQELRKEAQEAQQEFERATLRNVQEARRMTLDFNIEGQKAQFEEIQSKVKDALDENQITIQEYYDTERDLIERNARLELERIHIRIGQLEEERKQLQDTNKDRLRALEIEKEIQELKLRGQQAESQAEKDKRTKDREEDKSLKETGKELKQTFEQGVSQAIQDALNGQGIGNAIARFAKTLKEALIKAFADAIAQRISRAFTGLFDKIGEFFNKISGVSGQGGSVLPKGLTSGGTLNLPGLKGAGGKGTGSLLGKLQGLFGGTGGKIAGGALGGLGGAFAGFSVGKESGSILGGAGTGLLGGAALGMTFGGPVGAAIGAVVGAIGGTIGGIFGKSKSKKEAAKQKEIEQYTARYNTIVQGADANNLQDLTARYNQINATKSKGSATFALKKQAVAQIEQLMADRKKAIAAAIKEIAAQNEELVAQISLIGATPGDAIGIKRNIELRKVELETQALLEQYKDSEEAKTKILEQEALKRQLLLKEEQDAFKDSVANLQDLLIQRDDIANANVFQRLRSRETQKSDQLTELDREIASRVLEMQKALELGVQPLNTRGLNQVLQQVRSIGTVNADLQVIINQADDPNAVREEVTRAFESFMQKIYGANAA